MEINRTTEGTNCEGPKGNLRRCVVTIMAGLAGVALVATVDWCTDPQISMSIFYLLPVGLTTWYAGLRSGLLVSVAAAAAWFALDRRGVSYSHPFIPYWNALVRMGFFSLTAYLLKLIRTLTSNLETLVAVRTAALVAEIEQCKSSESRLTMLAQALESAAELICITDLENRFTFVNRSFCEAFGYPEGEILGKTPEILYSPNNPPSLIEEVLTRTRQGGWRGEVLDLRKDGTEFPIFLSTAQILNANSEVIGLIGVSRDITARKRFRSRLSRSTPARSCAGLWRQARN